MIGSLIFLIFDELCHLRLDVLAFKSWVCVGRYISQSPPPFPVVDGIKSFCCLEKSVTFANFSSKIRCKPWFVVTFEGDRATGNGSLSSGDEGLSKIS